MLIERYDRDIKQGNLIKGIQQEDFCQALGIASVYEYQAEGCPGFKECFDLLKRVFMPAVDRNKLFERIIFNYLIGNTDAHGKNLSLLRYESGLIKLAPAYDVLSSLIYPNLTKKMAMKIAGHYQYDEIMTRHWKRLCENIGYSYSRFKKIMIKQVEYLPIVLKNEVENLLQSDLHKSKFFDIDVAKKIIKFTESNCNKIIKQFTC